MINGIIYDMCEFEIYDDCLCDLCDEIDCYENCWDCPCLMECQYPTKYQDLANVIFPVDFD